MQDFGRTDARVVGLPPQFNLGKRLESATHVYLLTAFARWSGWQLLRPSFSKSRARLTLVAGSTQHVTEPRVLEDWMSLTYGRGTSYLYDDSPMFHPKVLFVESKDRRFAVVGSGNLTRAGLEYNIECGVYFDDRGDNGPLIEAIRKWIDGIVNSTACEIVEPPVLQRYKNEYEVVSRIDSRRKKERDRKLKTDAWRAPPDGTVRFVISDWQACIEALQEVLESDAYRHNMRKRREKELRYLRQLVKTLGLKDAKARKLLNAKKWRLAYGNWVPLGTIRAEQAQKAAYDLPALRKGLKLLANSNIDAAKRLGLVVKGPNTKVMGIGPNLASKFLLALEPAYYPVLNSEVTSIMERWFGARFTGRIRRGSGIPREGHEYAAFRRVMVALRQELGLPNMIELDRVIWLLDPSHRE